jgi:transposase
MPYSSSLTDREWEIIEPLLPSEEAHPTAAMVKTTNPGWSLVSTQERVQLV